MNNTEAWTMDEEGRNLYSDDFTHDAMLTLGGDFGTPQDRINYAKAICEKLNGQSIPKERLLEWVAEQIAFWEKEQKHNYATQDYINYAEIKIHTYRFTKRAITSGYMEGRGRDE